MLAPIDQSPARHHRLIIQHLEDVARGWCDRLMVLAPPGSAKSTYVSHLFPGWWLAQKPRGNVIAASHTGDFAVQWGRRVRNMISEHSELLGYDLASDEQAAGRWATTSGGTYGSFGLGGAVTGKRADLVILDDLVSGREDAESEAMRDKTYNWYRTDLYTRLKPGGAIVMVMTRWHPDDIGGRLLEDAERGGDKWRIIKLPAIAGENDQLGRKPGEPLWPDWEDAEALERKRRAVGERAWFSLYQQEPRPDEGALFATARIGTVDLQPAGLKLVRAWDLAATEKVGHHDPDWTVGVLMGKDEDGRFIVVDVVRVRGAPDVVERTITATAQRDGRGVPISLPQDPGQAGKSQVLYFARKLAGYKVTATPETGKKETRAAPLASQVNLGNVALVRADWNRELIEEMKGFPHGQHDDQVDAMSRAFNSLIAPPAPTRSARVPLMGR